MFPEIDFKVYKDKNQIKSFSFKNEDETVYNFTGSTVTMKYYKNGPTETPEEISGAITLATGVVSFNLLPAVLDEVGIFEYVIIETRSDTTEVPLIKGNIIIEEYVPFSLSIEAFLATELPTGMELDYNFRTQKIKYWRLFFQDTYDIPDSAINNDAVWPILVNALIAKLVVYDAIALALQGNLMAILGGNSVSTSSSTTTGDVKSIETGPAKVEFFPAGETVSQILRSTASSQKGNVLDEFQTSLCILARKLTLKLGMCKADKVVTIFQYHKNPDWGFQSVYDL